MIRISTSLASALFLCMLPALPAQDSGLDLKKLLAEQVRGAHDLPADEIWRRAAHVSEELPADDRKALSSEAEGLLASPDIDDGGKLMLAAISLSGSDPSASALAAALEPLLASPRKDVAGGAAELLADAHFKGLSADERKSLVDRLATAAEDGRNAPELRLSCANAWYVHGSGDDRRRARSLMNDFLASSDPELRAQGALALARSNAEITGTLFDELRRIATLPGEQGRLAEAYLETERVREQSERMFKRRFEELQAKVPDAKDPKGGTPDPMRDEVDQFKSVMRMIQTWHLEGDSVKRSQLLNAALDGMLRAMDEHSTYFDGASFARFEQELEAGYGGIGAYVGEDREDGLFTITHPIYSGPAYRAGLMSDDKIVRVEDWPTIGQPVDEVIKRLKGRPGTKVKLYIWRRGMERSLIDRPTEDMAFEIARESITIPTVQSQMLPGKIGMVVLHDFSRVASQEMRKSLLELMEQGAQGIVLDLRNDSGGLLDEAVNVASLFVPKGTLVVSTESRIEPKHSYVTTTDPIVPPEMPMAVLINRFTASAAEIVSGALQDHKRAVLVGKRSFGKGSVQNLIPVPGFDDDVYVDENKNGRHDNWEQLVKDWNKNGEFDFAPRVKLTIARYLLPSGRSIHRELDKEGSILNEGGVRPDLDIDLHQMQTWRIEEMQRILRTRAIRDWVDQQFSKGPEGVNKELMMRLADNDRRDPSQYPGFDALIAKLNTPLPADDVRALVRAEIRRRVQDMRGKEYPQGDFVEDQQLQEAIRVELKALGKTPEDFEEYRATIPVQSLARVSLPPQEKESVRAALDQIAKAKLSDGKLSSETLQRLSEILQSSLDQ